VFKHHTSAITTVEWSPDDSSVFASGGDDDQIGIWDLAVERDTTNDKDDIKVCNLFAKVKTISQIKNFILS